MPHEHERFFSELVTAFFAHNLYLDPISKLSLWIYAPCGRLKKWRKKESNSKGDLKVTDQRFFKGRKGAPWLKTENDHRKVMCAWLHFVCLMIWQSSHRSGRTTSVFSVIHSLFIQQISMGPLLHMRLCVMLHSREMSTVIAWGLVTKEVLIRQIWNQDWDLLFLTSPRWCWSCWSADHILSNKAL